MGRASAIYVGRVTHARLRPKRHRLAYRVFSLLLDLDELPRLGLWPLFGHDRRALVSFRNRDHGPGDGTPLRPWAEARMREAGVAPDGGPIRLLCYPRVLGYGFNPLGVWFCHRRDGTLAAMLYEVSNTFGERHTYAFAASPGDGAQTQSCAKAFHVSPFIGMEACYQFHVRPPDGRVSVAIRETGPEGLILTAVFAGARRALTARGLVAALARVPVLGVKVMAAIHWEALKLWRKGFAIHRHRAAAQRIASSAPGAEDRA